MTESMLLPSSAWSGYSCTYVSPVPVFSLLLAVLRPCWNCARSASAHRSVAMVDYLQQDQGSRPNNCAAGTNSCGGGEAASSPEDSDESGGESPDAGRLVPDPAHCRQLTVRWRHTDSRSWRLSVLAGCREWMAVTHLLINVNSWIATLRQNIYGPL